MAPKNAAFCRQGDKLALGRAAPIESPSRGQGLALARILGEARA
jgi:hypothetical protein